MASIRIAFLVLVSCFAIGVSAARAQSEPHGTAVLVGAGPINFDLSGTGTTFGTTLRVGQPIGANFSLEGSVLVARPQQQFGSSTLLIPEAHLQYHWTAGRFRPFAGAGVGAARVSSDVIRTDWDPTVSFAGGTQVRVNERFGVFGEFRLRGVEWDFVGTTTDVMAGLVWQVGR